MSSTTSKSTGDGSEHEPIGDLEKENKDLQDKCAMLEQIILAMRAKSQDEYAMLEQAMHAKFQDECAMLEQIILAMRAELRTTKLELQVKTQELKAKDKTISQIKIIVSTI